MVVEEEEEEEEEEEVVVEVVVVVEDNEVEGGGGRKSGILSSPLGPTSSPENRFKKLNMRCAVCKKDALDSSS